MDVLQMRARIAEPEIEQLVHRFYDAVRADPVLAPVFDAHIAANAWPAHLDRMVAFWSTVLRGTGRYRGNPIVAHFPLREVRAMHLARWLELFRTTARAVFDAECADAVIARAEGMGESLREAMRLGH